MQGFSFQRRKSAARAGGAAPTRKVHSIAGLLRDREIAGEFEAGGASYAFSFTPTSVALTGGRIELTGYFAAARVGGRKRAPMRGVRATLASTQGGLGRAPKVRRELLAATAQGAKTTTSDQQREKHPEGEQETPSAGARAGGRLPETEATGTSGFVGVMYLRLTPLDARALGVAADMSGVQLNVRLVPTSETERELQWLFSGLVAAAYGERPDERSSTTHVDAINRIFKG